MDAIDRELKRIEDLATRNGSHNCNCDCSSKVDQCEFDRHLSAPKAHKRLFDKKVDKEDGYSLISQECLEQICTNKDGIVLLEQYIRELQERNEKLEKELLDKANGQWTVYTTLDEIGVTLGQETIESISLSLPSNSELHYTISNADGVASGNLSIYPTDNDYFGYIRIYKRNPRRIIWELAYTNVKQKTIKYFAHSRVANDSLTQWSGREKVTSVTVGP